MTAPHSPEARAIADLFGQSLVVCGVIFAVVAGLVLWCVVRFRAREGAPAPAQAHGNKRLEIAWTIVPLLIIVWLFVATARTMAASDAPQGTGEEPDLVITGHQWWWEARYRSGAVTANEIHVPVGKRLVAEVRSDDVVHDFWVPELGRKIDATPGHPTRIWLEADTPGTYAGACAEYCGAQHAWMRIAVVADAPADFDAWERRETSPSPSPPGLFQRMTCARCHGIETRTVPGGTRVGPPAMELPRVGPDLTHLASRKTLGAGVLANTPDNLFLWLKDPQAIKPGSHMPSLQLTDDQARELVSYFETLR